MLKILSVAVLWFAGLFTLTLSLGFDLDQALQAGLIGVIIAMVIVAAIFVLPSEYTRAVFFGSEEDIRPTEGLLYSVIGCLTDGIPIILLLLAFLIFIVRQLAPSNRVRPTISRVNKTAGNTRAKNTWI